jgi:hypothetical protein
MASIEIRNKPVVSRSFLVGMAVLNAATLSFPVAKLSDTIPAILGSYLRRGNIPRWLQRRVGEEFRKLGNSYEVAQ